MARIFNPKSLLEIARMETNRNLLCKPAIDHLPLPLTLLQDLKEYYLSDKLTCEEYWPSYDDGNCWFEFEQPWLNVGDDGYLSLMNWDHVPPFGFELNHVTQIWFRFTDWNINGLWDNETDYLCHRCYLNIMCQPSQENILRYVSCLESCEKVTGDSLIEFIQGQDMWCSNCKTCALFYIENATENTHRRCRYSVNSIARYESINGRWSKPVSA